MSLQSGWDRDSQAKKGGMAGLTGKNGRESGNWEAYWGPSKLDCKGKDFTDRMCGSFYAKVLLSL